MSYVDSFGALYYRVYNQAEGWNEPIKLPFNQVGNLTMVTYYDYALEENRLLLAWRELGTNQILSSLFDGQKWSNELPVGQYTDGAICAGSLGSSVYLVYKERNTFNMRMTSFNTGTFNSFKALDFQSQPDPDNDTSLHKWSPMDFVVGHFSKKQNQHEDSYLANGRLTMASIEGEMHLCYRARYSDTPYVKSTIFGLTGIMTAENETTNGFGTLNQAGWTLEITHESIEVTPDGANTLISKGDELIHIYLPKGDSKLSMRKASYQSKTIKQEEDSLLEV